MLIKYLIFTEFLKENYLEIYTELCKNYAEVLCKIYVSKFKSYVKDLEKYSLELYNKHDTLLAENPSYVRNFTKLNVDRTKLELDTKSVFSLLNRD